MDDLISRQTLLNKFEPWLKVKDYNDGELNMLKAVLYEIRFMPYATDKNVGTKLCTDLAEVGTDCISRRAAIDEIEYELEMIDSALDSITLDFNARERLRQRRGEAREILNSIQQLPSVQLENKQQAINSSDCIDRRAALDALRKMQTYKLFSGDDMLLIDQAGAMTELMLLPSAQLEGDAE